MVVCDLQQVSKGGCGFLLGANVIFFPGVVNVSERCFTLHTQGDSMAQNITACLPAYLSNVSCQQFTGGDRQKSSGIYSELSMPFIPSLCQLLSFASPYFFLRILKPCIAAKFMASHINRAILLEWGRGGRRKAI